MNATERLREYLRDPQGTLAYFDVDVDFLRSALSKRDFDPVEDYLAFCESIGNAAFFGLGDLTRYIPELVPETTIIAADQETHTKRITLHTPLGEKSWTLPEKRDAAAERISEATATPVAALEDFALFDWYLELVDRADWTECVRDVRRQIERFGQRAIPGMFLCPPFELLYWAKRDQLFYLYFDHRADYEAAMDKILAAYESILEVACDAGIQLVGYGAPGGTEFTSPAIWRDAIVPWSQRIEALVRKHDMWSLFHCCGKVSRLIDDGFISDIQPTIYETAAAPPVGDVVNLGVARRNISSSIITHGNMDLTFLRDATTEDVKRRAQEIVEETRGYQHIVGAGDACLWPRTPVENLVAVLDVARPAG